MTSPFLRVNVTVALLVSACATTAREREAVNEPTEARLRIVSGTPAVAPTATVASDLQWTDSELALWNDPDFKRRFTESYIAETDIEPRVTERERAQLQQVLELIGAQDVSRAATLLRKSGGPAASAVFDFTLGNLYFQQEELFQASSAYSDAVGKYPKFRRAWKNLALVHVRRGEFDEAAAAFARVIELGGGDAVTYGLLGFTYANLGQHMSAESAYRLAVLLDPITPDWAMGLARSFFEQKRYADAVTLCGELIAKDPNRVDLWLLQANAFIGLDQPMRAAENFEIALGLGYAASETRTTLGDIYVNEQLFELGVQNYLLALEERPEPDAARLLRAAKIMTAQGAHTECAALIAGIESIVGGDLETGARAELLKIKVRLAAARGAGEEEASTLEQIVQLDPLDGEALILLGQHWGRVGEVEKAVFYFERAEGLEAFEADARVRHAQLLVGEGRYAESLPLLRRAQALRPRENIQRYLEQIERAAQSR